MSLISMHGAWLSFSDAPLLDNAELHIEDNERVCLVGRNGAGKSTLMKILNREQGLDDGRIIYEQDLIVARLQQDPPRNVEGSVYDFVAEGIEEQAEYLKRYHDISRLVMNDPSEKNLNELAKVQEQLDHHNLWQLENRINEVLAQLGLDPNVALSSLSGGWLRKAALGRALVSNPRVLLLDEPTNYLDAEHIEWLKRYLQDYENAFILISHDIPFLNSVINLIYNMENQKLDRYVGDYDKFKEVHAVKQAQLEAAYNRQQKEIADLKDFVARNKARVSTRNMAMSRQKKLDNMDLIELAGEKPKPEFRFKEARTSGKFIIDTMNLVIGYDKPLSVPLNLSMERGQKIAVIGTNGIGKTTLLRSILGEIKPIDGKVELGDYLQIGYFEQEIKEENRSTCLEEIWDEFPSFNQYEVRSALAKCGLTTNHIESQIRVLSGGEQAKVRLCKLINRETNLLVLDEPTNHLDVDAKAELKRALTEYKGSILMVCHEPDFYEDWVTDVWDVSQWSLLD